MTTQIPASGLLADRTVLVTGVLRPSSIATAVAEVAARQGARVVLTAHPRTARATESVARRLLLPDPVLPLDLADPAHPAGLAAALEGIGTDRLDGVVHAVAHAGPDLLGGLLPGPDADLPGRAHDLEAAFTVSAASLAALVAPLRPVLAEEADVVALTFDSGRVHPGYGWMGPLKAALEASVRGLAAELGPAGVRVNAVSAGPLVTPAAAAVPGFADMIEDWRARSPLGWDPADATPVARTVVALLAGWLPATTGQVVRADGGAWLQAR